MRHATPDPAAPCDLDTLYGPLARTLPQGDDEPPHVFTARSLPPPPASATTGRLRDDNYITPTATTA